MWNHAQENKTKLPTQETALKGRPEPSFEVPTRHFVSANPIQPPFAPGVELAMFGMGCFWGAERRFWQLEGVLATAAGYAAGYTPHPTYKEVCSGQTGHNEVVLVIYDPTQLSYAKLLETFWQSHNPTHGMRQGNDVGTQYRSGIYTFTAVQLEQAQHSKQAYGERLRAAGHGEITTELLEAPVFYYAEDYHQQYLAKNPGGYCGLGGTGVSCPQGLVEG